MNFVFPHDLEIFEVVHNKQELKKFLNSVSKEQNLSEQAIYKYSVSSKYLYARCRHCSAFLRYIRSQQNIFILKKSNRSHQHKKVMTKIDVFKKAIENLPNGLTPRYARSIIEKKFSLSRSTFYRLYSKIKNQPIDFKALVNSLCESNLIGYYQPLNLDQSSLPQLLIISSNACRDAFKNFGEVVSFDITYNVCRQKNSQGKQYCLGALVGLSSSLKILPFALVITCSETSQSMAKIFYQLFRLLGNKPRVIITDQQASIRSGLNILRYQNLWTGEHLLDSFHLINNVRKKLKQKNNIKYFQKIMFAKSKSQFSYQYQRSLQNLQQNDRDVFIQFVQKYQYSCYSSIQQFIGLSISSSPNEKINDLIKKVIPRSEKVLVLCKKVSNFFNETINKNLGQCTFETVKAENFLQIQELKQIRKQVCKRIFCQITQCIKQSIKCLRDQKDAGKCFVKDQYSVQKLMKQGQKWKCSCGYSLRSGLPCSHLIKNLLCLQIQITPYISQKWKVYNYIKKQHIIQKINIGMPRKSRRNIRK